MASTSHSGLPPTAYLEHFLAGSIAFAEMFAASYPFCATEVFANQSTPPTIPQVRDRNVKQVYKLQVTWMIHQLRSPALRQHWHCGSFLDLEFFHDDYCDALAEMSTIHEVNQWIQRCLDALWIVTELPNDLELMRSIFDDLGFHRHVEAIRRTAQKTSDENNTLHANFCHFLLRNISRVMYVFIGHPFTRLAMSPTDAPTATKLISDAVLRGNARV